MIERIDQLFPEHIGQRAPRRPTEPPDSGFFEAFDQEARPVGADGDAYLQFIDWEALLALGMEEDLVVRLERRPGDYVVASRPLALVWPGSRVTDRLTDQVRSLFVLGHQRTFDQDIEFGVNQLVEIAVRALSPGLNDPFTAMTCVDHLGSALCRLASRDMPSPYRHDRQNQLRVIAPGNTPEGVVDAGFVHRPEDHATLLRHAEMIARGASEGLPEAADRRVVEERCQAVSRLCEPADAGR